MAAGTPVIRYPSAGATDVPVDAPWQALKSPYDGTGTQVEVEWRIAENAGMTTNVVSISAGLRAPDDHRIGDDWIDVFPGLVPLKAGTTYYIDVRTRNDSAETATSAVVSFTTEARLTGATWAAAQ